MKMRSSRMGRWYRPSTKFTRTRGSIRRDSSSRSASIRPSMRASTALTSSRSLAARSSRALNAASNCAWEGGLAAVWAAAAILLHTSNAMREQERTRNNFMDVVRLAALDEVCFGKGSAHPLPVVLRGRDGQPVWITRADRGPIVCGRFCCSRLRISCRFEWTHHFESGGELVRDLVIGYVVCLGLSIFDDWSRRWSALGGGREAFRALIAQLAVRSVMVVLAARVLNNYASFGQCPELLPVEALVAEGSMETLDEAILPRTAGLDIDRLDLVGVIAPRLYQPLPPPLARWQADLPFGICRMPASTSSPGSVPVGAPFTWAAPAPWAHPTPPQIRIPETRVPPTLVSSMDNPR